MATLETAGGAEAEAEEWDRQTVSDGVRERCAVIPAGATADRAARAAGVFGAVDPLVGRSCLAARLALAGQDLARAGRFAALARGRALLLGTSTDRAAACCAQAAVYRTIGDGDALLQNVAEGLDAARRAHAPLRAVRLRVLLAAGLRQAGRSTEARGLLARLERLDPKRLPAVVRVPLERLLSEASASRVAAVVPGQPGDRARHPGASTDILRTGLSLATADAVVEVLGLCQTIEDEGAALRAAVGLLRGRLRAASLGCVGLEDGQVVVLASQGGELGSEGTGRRAIEAGLAISPASSGSGLDAAVPIRLGGAVVGALVGRWPADLPPEWSGVHALMSAFAAAVAPCVRAVLDRRACPAGPGEAGVGEIVGVSDAIVRLRREIARAAGAPFNVVIEGESGSGKELVARAIHGQGPRRHRALCALNCAALADDLVEAELFGHARGAFTGAIAERKGLFEEADRGTLVLDEIGELSARAQAKLLRALQEGEVRRVGENFARAVDVRIVAATNRPLRPAVEAGLFRQDLLYRLEVIRIVVPPLRARAEDVPVLAAHFWRQVTGRLGSRSTLAPATVATLARYDWPGNVRELQNVLAALAVAVGRRGSVGPERLPGIVARQAATAPVATLEDARRVFEVRFVRAALARAGGHRARAARDLGLSRQGLVKLLSRLGLDA